MYNSAIKSSSILAMPSVGKACLAGAILIFMMALVSKGLDAEFGQSFHA
jgi:hypothetical protein